MKKVCGKLNLEEKVMDHGGNCLSCAISEVSSYLVKSLGNRISLLGIRPHKYKNVSNRLRHMLMYSFFYYFIVGQCWQKVIQFHYKIYICSLIIIL